MGMGSLLYSGVFIASVWEGDYVVYSFAGSDDSIGL
jgi:hypothetical protein